MPTPKVMIVEVIGKSLEIVRNASQADQDATIELANALDAFLDEQDLSFAQTVTAMAILIVRVCKKAEVACAAHAGVAA